MANVNRCGAFAIGGDYPAAANYQVCFAAGIARNIGMSWHALLACEALAELGEEILRDAEAVTRGGTDVVDGGDFTGQGFLRRA